MLNKQLIKSLKLDRWLMEQFQQPDSVASKFLENFSLAFILDRLNQEEKQVFAELLVQGQTEALLPFVKQHIPDFENQFQKALKEKIINLKNQVLEKK